MAASRLFDFQPGYFYGSLAGLAFGSALPEKVEGKMAVANWVFGLAVSVGAFFLRAPVSAAAAEPGSSWNRSAWAVLFFAGLFVAIHVLLQPGSGHVGETTGSVTIGVIVLYAVVGVGSIAFWAYFRFRPPGWAAAKAWGVGRTLVCMGDARGDLTDLIRDQLAERDICSIAGTYLLEVELRERLAALGVEPSPDVSVALMAAAMLLAEKTPEWGGDCRDALGEIAQLGLSLLLEGEGR